jgi:hypothetical protein
MARIGFILPLVVVCEKAPPERVAYGPVGDRCPYCGEPLADHEIRTWDGEDVGRDEG